MTRRGSSEPMDLAEFIENPPVWSDGDTIPMVDMSREDWRGDVRRAVAQAWAEGHRAALDGVFPLRREDNPYRGQT